MLKFLGSCNRARNICTLVLSFTFAPIYYAFSPGYPFSSVQFSHVWLFVTPQTVAHQASLCITNSAWSCWNSCPSSWWCIHPSLLCSPLLLLPSVLPSIRIFSDASVLHIRWPRYWSFSYNISPSNEYSGLISFRIDWFDLAVQGTLKSLLQHCNSKASILRHSTFFMVQFSHPVVTYMTTGKTIALTRQIFVAKVMSLLFNMLSTFVLALLSRSKRLLILWLQSPSAVILKPKKIKSVIFSTFFPIYLPWNDGIRWHDLQFLNVEFEASFFTLFFHFH